MTTNSPDKVRTCRDCGVELQPIRLLDATHPGFDGQGTGQVDLKYASPGGRPSIWTGKIPVAGFVLGMACPQCGLIQLYAVENP